jgi:hypothetical protein
MMKTGTKFLLAVTSILAVMPYCFSASVALAQEMQASIEDLPATRDLAAVLSEPASRTDALLSLIALSHMLHSSALTEPGQATGLDALFRDDRAWLDRLALRYSSLPSRSSLLDPAAWFIQQELEQHGMVSSLRVSPLGPGYDELLAQLFDRSDERLAAALLPEVLFQAEFIATTVWQQLLSQAAANQNLLAVLSRLSAGWPDSGMAAKPAAPPGKAGPAGILQRSLLSLQAQMSAILLPQPPDALRVKHLRFSLLSAMPEMDPNQTRTARHMLRLASAVDGLYDQRYLEFIESLLWVVTDLLEMYRGNPDAASPLVQVLVEFLPRLSNVMARNFAEVDSRFNAHLAAAFEVVQELQSGALTGGDFGRLRQELADSVTQLVLLVPEMAFYFDQPVRRRISEEIDRCISLAAARDDHDKPKLSRKQFDGCLKGMGALAATRVRRAELAGDPGGPFGADQLLRELEMAPWQRINYTLGYLHARSPVVCPLPDKPLPNPLEWSALATLMVWFSSQSPVYFQTPENEALIVALRQQGLEVLRIMSQQVDCISGSGGRFNDLISVSLQQYRGALANLVAGIGAVELEFREAHLRAGADVDLGGNARQKTAYRTAELLIGPCDVARACETSQQLDATRALIGQFPDEYLIAEQTGLGSVEICYDNMQWIERRMEHVRPEDSNVANYYGHLSFDLVGRYRQGESVTAVFGANFISPREYHYLIAASSDEVLNDGCPSEWVGSRIATTRNIKKGINIVPRRLTYLAAARNKPAEVISANWDHGAEWRDWFVTGIGVKELEFPPDPFIAGRLEQHLRALYRAEQQAIYRSLLKPAPRTWSTAAAPLFDLVNEVSMYKGLLRHQLILFYPEVMLDADEIRAAMEGQGGLLDEAALRRLQENNVAVAQIHDTGLARLKQFQAAWKRQPEVLMRSGSVAASVAHAVARLNALYREYFATLAPVSVPLETAPANPTGGSAGSAAPER